MADKYLDHGLYSAPKAGGTAPDSNGAGGYWAEDGNGAAATKASCAVAAITVSDYTQWVAGSDSLSVIGATAITIAAPSSNNDMASKLATAINNSTATNGNSSVNTKTTQLRNIVNAVASGATVTIYSRTGGTEWNSMSVTTTKAAAFSTSFPVTFSGATNGAWGYQFNTSSLWPSGLAAFTYGCWVGTPYFTGTLADNDRLLIRPKTIAFTNSVTTFQPAVMGSALGPVTFEIDDGTGTVSEWSGDADYTVNDVQVTVNNSTGSFGLVIPANCFIHILGKMSLAGVRTLKFTAGVGSTASAGQPFYVRPVNPCRIDNLDLDASASAMASQLNIASGLYSGGRAMVFNNPRFACKNGSIFIYYASGSDTRSVYEMNNPVFDNAGNTNLHAGIIYSVNAFQNSLRLRSPVFQNFITGSRLVVMPAGAEHNIDITDPVFGNVTDRPPVMSTLGIKGYDVAQGRIVISSSKGAREFCVDTHRGYVDWNASRSYPTRSAQLPDGTPWSWRVVPPTSSGAAIASSPLVLPKIAVINSNADGARTIKVYFGIADTLSWTKREVSVCAIYTDVNGNTVILDSYDHTGGALTTDASTWSVEQSGKIKWDNLGTILLNKYRIELATPTGRDMEADTEVQIFFRVHTHVSATDRILFVDPEPTIV